MRRKFIINPNSGRALAAEGIASLEAFFTAKTGSFDCAVARSRDEAVRITRESLREGIEQVVAVGGDGTANAVANGFFEGGRTVRPESCLAVANAGTGSDYFKSLTAGTPVVDWKDLVLENVPQPVDVGRIHYADPDRCDQYFVNMASAGMVAEVVRKKQRGPGWLPPGLRYLAPTISSVLSYRPTQAEVELDGECLDLEAMVISICKGVYAGRGMRFGGAVTLLDGLFDVTLFQPMGRVEMLLKLRKLYTGSFQGEPAIRKLKARRVSIRASSAVPVEFDGELGGTTDVELSVEPGALRVCLPKGATTSPGA